MLFRVQQTSDSTILSGTSRTFIAIHLVMMNRFGLSKNKAKDCCRARYLVFNPLGRSIPRSRNSRVR